MERESERCDLRKKFSALKISGILAMISTIFIVTSIVLTSSRHASSHGGLSDTNTTSFDLTNTSLCDFAKSFPISRQVYVTVCLYNKAIRIDLRLFLNHKATIKGIYLTTSQWKRLLAIVPFINGVLDTITYIH